MKIKVATTWDIGNLTENFSQMIPASIHVSLVSSDNIISDDIPIRSGEVLLEPESTSVIIENEDTISEEEDVNNLYDIEINSFKNDNGQESTYYFSMEKTSIESFPKESDTDPDYIVSILFTYKPLKNFSIRAYWDDEDNAYNTRPTGQYEISFYKGNEVIADLTLEKDSQDEYIMTSNSYPTYINGEQVDDYTFIAQDVSGYNKNIEINLEGEETLNAIFSYYKYVSSAWINQIKYHQGTAEEQIFNIGTTFDQVRFSQSNKTTLKDVFEEIKTFFGQKMFMIQSKKDPTNSPNIVEWYQILEENSSNEDDTSEETNEPEETNESEETILEPTEP